MRRLSARTDLFIVCLVAAAVAALVLFTGGIAGSRSGGSEFQVAEVDGVRVSRVGVTTADGRVAECLVTSEGGIACFDPTEDDR